MGKYDTYTVALLLMDSKDGGTAFRDEAGKTWAAGGDAQHDTAQKKYGTASCLFDGTGEYLLTANSADWDFGPGDWTIEAWIYSAANQADYAGIISLNSSANTGLQINFWDSAHQNKVQIWSKVTGTWANNLYSSSAIANTTWTHLALERFGNTVTLYFGGVSVGTYDCTGKTYTSSGTGVVLGRAQTDGGPYFNGQMDEVRISKGIARYQGAFTPPERSLRLGGLFTFHG